MSEQDDKSPDGAHNFNWLATTNTELRNRIKNLEVELYHWRLNAAETKEQLRRVYQNRNTHNYVDWFYNSSVKNLVKSLTEQNAALKQELCIKDTSILLEQKRRIHMLENKLETTTKENKHLKNEIENIKCTDAVDKLKTNVHAFRTNNSKLTYENTHLKNQLKNQADVISVLKSEFSKQRREFIKLFMENYLQHGETFIQQLQSMDGNAIPDFLSKSDVSTSTVDPNTSTGDLISSAIPKADILDEPLTDSGCCALSEKVQELTTELMSKNREIEEASNKIAHLEEELKCPLHASKANISGDSFKDSGVGSLSKEVGELWTELLLKNQEIDRANNKITELEELNCKTNRDNIEMQTMQSMLTSLSEENEHLINHTKMLEEDAIRNRDDLAAARTEARKANEEVLSLKAVLEIVREENAQHGQSYSSESRTQESRTRLSRGRELREPYEYTQWHYNTQQPQLVRDKPTTKSSPTETQDCSPYSPKGPLTIPPPPPPPLRDPDPNLKYHQDTKRSPEGSVPSLRRPSERSSKFIQCDKCKEMIEVEKFGVHSRDCR